MSRMRLRETAVSVVLGATLVQGYSAPAFGNDVTFLASELGITPETAVLAGLTATDATTFLTRIDAATSLRRDLATAREEASQHCAIITECQEHLFLDPGDDAMLAKYEAAQRGLARAEDTIASLRTSLLETALDGYATSTSDTLARFACQQQYKTPEEFAALEYSDDQMTAVEAAVAAERRALRLGFAVPLDAQALLAQAWSDSKVLTASGRLSSSLDSMRLVFESYK
jgi:hypothetical protein